MVTIVSAASRAVGMVAPTNTADWASRIAAAQRVEASVRTAMTVASGMDQVEATGRRVCVIGAGIAGLVTAKVLRDDGFEVIVFERSPTIGGVWAPSRTYPGLRANNPRETYAFSDFPYPRTADDFPTAEQWAKEVFPARTEGYFVGPFLAPYIDELMRDMRLETCRTQHFVAEYFGPFWPSRYHDVGRSVGERSSPRGREFA